MTNPVIVVGASLAGLRTAETLRRNGWTGAIVVFGEEDHPPYNRPPLSKQILTTDAGYLELALPRRASIADVGWQLGVKVVSADLERKFVTTDVGTRHAYQALVAATGLRPRHLHPHSPDMAGRHTLRTLNDAQLLRADLRPGARVIVAGAGPLGCEIAASARELGCQVTVVSAAQSPLQSIVPSTIGVELLRRHESRGIRFQLGKRVTAVLGQQRVEGVTLADDTHLQGDVLVEAIGAQPNVEWLAGNDVDTDCGILTDPAMRVLRRDGNARTDTFGVGDVARFPNPYVGTSPTTFEHWTMATETSRRAGVVLATHLTNPDAYEATITQLSPPLPTFWSDQGDVPILGIGKTAGTEHVRPLEGKEKEGEFIIGCYETDQLVGVCGIGSPASVLRYRHEIRRPSIETAIVA